MPLSWRRHLVVWLAPIVYTTALVLMYFSGVPLLRSIVAPAFSREFGLLESTQHLVLLVAVVLAVLGFRRATSATEYAGFAVLGLAFFFLLLEEINYGEFYWQFVTGQSVASAGRGEDFNLHNKISTSPIKTLANVVLLVFFVIMPLLVRERAPAWLRYLAPPRALILTVLASVAVSQFAHYLNDPDGPDHALRKNIAEFRELFVYYIGLLYVYELAFRRRWPGWRREDGAAPAPP